jgi:hypothetical protein
MVGWSRDRDLLFQYFSPLDIKSLEVSLERRAGSGCGRNHRGRERERERDRKTLRQSIDGRGGFMASYTVVGFSRLVVTFLSSLSFCWSVRRRGTDIYVN